MAQKHPLQSDGGIGAIGAIGTMGTIGHNSGDLVVSFVVKGFNSIAPFVAKNGAPRALSLPVGATLRDVVQHLQIPSEQIYLAMRNGRDVTPGLYPSCDPCVNLDVEIEEGDQISFSGPVPYSYGYGSAVV